MSRLSRTSAPPVAALLSLFTAMTMSAHPVQARVTVPSFFSDNMMLQANTDARVFGHALPAEDIEVKFAGKTVKAKADKAGQWAVSLRKLKPGTRGVMQIKGTNKIEIKNVLVGEVWICAGQSNISLAVKDCTIARSIVQNYTNPEIRFLEIEPDMANSPRQDCSAKWHVCNRHSLPEFSAIGAILAHDLHDKLHKPVGIIQSAYGGSSIKTWISADLAKDARFSRELAVDANSPTAFMKFAIDKDEKERAVKPSKPRKLARTFIQPLVPCSLFNAMISPLTNYSIKGIAWYQGEADAEDAGLYGRLFPAMIEDWRRHFNQGTIPFVYVQLPGFDHEPMCNPHKDSWAKLREAQTRALTVPNTAMVVAIDQGQPGCLHPKDKTVVAQRLARAILAKAYGGEDATAPTLEKATGEGGKVICRFAHASGLKTTGRARGFEICGADRIWLVAEAALQGNSVILQSNKCPKPVAVRYAWANYPDGNLYNSLNLPAVPFCTDLHDK